MRKLKFIQLSCIIAVVVGLFDIGVLNAQKIISEDEAINLIRQVPEVKTFVKQIAKSGNEVKVIIRQEIAIGKDGGELYEFYVGESHPTHTVCWNRFAVNKKTKAIFVFDTKVGDYIPLSKWQNK